MKLILENWRHYIKENDENEEEDFDDDSVDYMEAKNLAKLILRTGQFADLRGGIAMQLDEHGRAIIDQMRELVRSGEVGDGEPGDFNLPKIEDILEHLLDGYEEANGKYKLAMRLGYGSFPPYENEMAPYEYNALFIKAAINILYFAGYNRRSAPYSKGVYEIEDYERALGMPSRKHQWYSMARDGVKARLLRHWNQSWEDSNETPI